MQNKKMRIVGKYYNYLLLQLNEGDKHIYKVYNKDTSTIQYSWVTRREDLERMSQKERDDSMLYELFYNWVDDHRPKQLSLWDDEDDGEELNNDRYPSEDEEDEDNNQSYYNFRNNYFRGNYYQQYNKPFTKGLKDELMKSDTLVIHCKDNTTEMLCQIYEGKGWDVVRDGNIDPEELRELIRNHKKIVMLGHGTAGGLINVQRHGFIIDSSYTNDLKGKQLFVIWCNADAFFNRIGIGKGMFITGNMPSEVWECRAAGCGDISSELMLENITYWSKLCADVVDRCLSGDVKGSVKYIRDKYIEKYGDHPVTIYNAERTKVHGEPLEDLSYLLRDSN